MNPNLKEKSSKRSLLVLLAVLALLAPLGSTLVTKAAQAGKAQGRGRRIVSLTQPPAVPSQQPLAHDPEMAALADESATHFRARIVRFDVAENQTRFSFDETPVFPDGLPAYGNEFITEGYIYPHGTLDSFTDGVNADGSPQFPDKVIGRWVCRGWHVGDGAHTTTGPVVITHQLYDFDDEAGKVTLTTDGIELADVDVPFKRAIIGGTGPFAQARGEATQTFLGFHQFNGVKLRFELRVAVR